MSWLSNLNFNPAGPVSPNNGVGRANGAARPNNVQGPNLLGASGGVDRAEFSNPLGLQANPAPTGPSTASIVNAVSKLDVNAAKAQLSPNVQEGLALFGSAAPPARSTPENTDVRNLVNNISQLNLDQASGQLNAGTLYGLQAFGALGGR